MTPSGYKSVLKCSTNPLAFEKSKMLAPKRTSMVLDAQTSCIVRRMLENIYLTCYKAEALLCPSLVNDVFYGYVPGTYVSNVPTENEKDLFRNHLSAKWSCQRTVCLAGSASKNFCLSTLIAKSLTSLLCISILLKTLNVANLLGRHVYILSRPNLLPRESGYCASVWVECCVG